MHSQRIILRRWDWIATVYYDTSEEDAGRIVRHIEELNPSPGDLSGTRSLLSSGRNNEGMTFSSYSDRESVIVIGAADSPGEFFNTMLHEGFHLAKHICQCDGIDPFSEEAAYCMGDLCGKMFSSARRLLCK